MDQDAELTFCYVVDRCESGLVGDLRSTDNRGGHRGGAGLRRTAPSSGQYRLFRAVPPRLRPRPSSRGRATRPRRPSSPPVGRARGARRAQRRPLRHGVAAVMYMRVRTTSSSDAPASASAAADDLEAAPRLVGGVRREGWPPGTTGPVPDTTTRWPDTDGPAEADGGLERGSRRDALTLGHARNPPTPGASPEGLRPRDGRYACRPSEVGWGRAGRRIGVLAGAGVMVVGVCHARDRHRGRLHRVLPQHRAARSTITWRWPPPTTTTRHRAAPRRPGLRQHHRWQR